MNKKQIPLIAAAILLCGCYPQAAPAQSAPTAEQQTEQTVQPAAPAEKLKITAAGSYTVTGNTPVTVDAEGMEVELVLQNANITVSDRPAINIKAAKKVKITLPAGTHSVLANTCTQKDDKDNKTASAIYSKADIELEGQGSLTLTSDKGMGIKCKQSVSAKDLTLAVTSAQTCISADKAAVNSGNITLTAGSGDEKGKGIKTDTDLTVNGGNISITTNNDALHSNALITVNSGNILINADDDALHANEGISVNGGEISIPECSEGIEAPSVIINGGIIDITAKDDGINATKGDGSDTFMHADSSLLTINGGAITIHSKGDGIDSNGNILMNGGEVTVSGPDSDMDSALDFDGKFEINGGRLIAYGSAGMAQAPQSGTVNTVCITAQMKAGQPVTVMGIETVTVTPDKDCRSLVISDEGFKTGESYTVTSGTETVAEIEITSPLTYAGERMSFGGRPGFGGGKRPDFGGGKRPEFSDNDHPDFPNGDPPDFGNFGDFPDFPDGAPPAPPQS